ncbi:unnamed protein product [Prorocentrum cordatum]|uniref:TIR domain-containing protein n=1 Tax=Prorocentrum cordatum TaxID=2364126 RepID=A0ABN9UQG2_9DINO|nr:unnamed protein product [Polarella glacialis]
MLERHTGGRRIVRLVNVDTSDVLAADVEPGPGQAGWTDLAAAKAALIPMIGVLATCAWHLLRRTTCPGLGPGPRCPGPTGPPDRLCEGPPAARLDGLPEGLPESRPEGLPDDGPEGRPEGLPEGRPEGLPDDRADGRPHDGPDDRPDGRAEGPPDDRPDGLPEGLPEGRLESLTDDRPGGRLGDGADDRPDGRPEEPPDDRPVGPPQKPGHVFFSLRFKEAMAAAQVLKKRLEELGYSVFLCDALAGEDIFRNLICKNLESADFAVIFGTETYGQKTHEVMSTFQELLWILNHAGEADKYSRLQKVAVLKMCERYKEVCTQMALHKALSYIEWDGSETAAQKVCGKIHRAFSSTGSIRGDSSSGS